MTALSALLLAGCALWQAGAAPSERQTPWQRELFARVQESARAASERATPELLERLDSKALRAQLAACCPSTRNLTARQLLDRLEADMAVAEVISGFPAVQDANDIFPDGPGMSIADGITGSFFQNAWQNVLRHTNDPASVFRNVVKNYRLATCNTDSGTLHVETWAAPACAKPLVSKETHRLGRCTYDPVYETTTQYVCHHDGKAQTNYWWDDQQQLLRHRRASSRGSWRPSPGLGDGAVGVSCPNRSADYSEDFSADGSCHGFVVSNSSKGWVMEDTAELRCYGLRPFLSEGDPQTTAEAAERGPYTAVNRFHVDSGSPLYGDVSAVFSLRAIRESALLSAIDTGFWSSQCAAGKSSFNNWWGFNTNCSAYTPLSQLGTMDHFNHLFLMNEGYWTETSTLALQFARREGHWGKHRFETRHLLQYFEALPAARLQYPDDVRFLIASFPSLFGTEVGLQLQQWARQRGWLLVWSLGFNYDDVGVEMGFSLLSMNRSRSANQRFVDPVVALETTAATSLPLANATGPFLGLWAKAASMGNYSTEGRADNATWASMWDVLVDALPALRVRPLRGGDCPRSPDEPECAGVSLDGRCVCYSKGRQDLQLLV